MTDNLTLDKLYEAIKAATPVQYYADVLYLSRGKVLFSKSDGFFPDVVFVHPDDVPELRTKLAGICRLVDFRTWEPSLEDAASSTAHPSGAAQKTGDDSGA